MSNYFGLNLSVLSRSRGQSAVERSAYQRRTSVQLADGSIIDHSGRNDHVANFVVTPDGAPAWALDCDQVWQRAAAAEKRADAQEARAIELSLPRELATDDWIEIARRIASVTAKHGMIVQVDIHCPVASDGGLNPHVHFLISLREIRDGEFARTKNREWNKLFYGKVSAMRRDMAEILNRYCQSRGIAYHADHRSNAERGLPPAEVRIPRWNVLHYKRTGQKTRAMKQLDAERTLKANIARIEAELNEAEHELKRAQANAVSPKRIGFEQPFAGSTKVNTAKLPFDAVSESCSFNDDSIAPRYGPT